MRVCAHVPKCDGRHTNVCLSLGGSEKTPTANRDRQQHRGNTSANSFTERVKLQSTFPFFFFASYHANNAIEIEKHFNH